MNDLRKPLADLAAAMTCRPASRTSVDMVAVLLTALAALTTLALALSL